MTLTARERAHVAHDAPAYHGKGRECARCGRKVNGYQEETVEGHVRALLCFTCNRRWADSGLPLRRFAAVRERTLPRGRRPGAPLPGLKEVLERRKVAVWELAEATGVSYHHIMAVRRGRKNASAECRDLLAGALGVDAEALL